MTFGSLFSGIGGLDLGLERAGWDCRWQVEHDAYCQQVLAKHWPSVPRFGDIKELDTDDLERVDLVAGGPPCQPVSRNGLKKAQDDERWLWPQFLRVVRDLRPRLALMENVTGILDRGLGDILGELAESGFDAEWDCIPAAAFGAHHQRDRFFLVVHAAGARLQGQVAGRFLRSEVLSAGSDRWGAEPDVGRVADGVPHRVDRLRALGNAVVPAVGEWIGRRLAEVAA